jgi:tRNA A-37 threonylcarbamoyl transferase component Bud32
MNFIVTPSFNSSASKINNCIQNFSNSGEVFIEGKRNKIKLFKVESDTLNIKAFKMPSFLNSIIYKYFRKSKARRSYEYGNQLLTLGIGTPRPIAYFENTSLLGLKDSYYVSEHLVPDLTYRELVEVPNYPDSENIQRQFTQFCYKLHQKGIEFKDHSPGNTLIRKNDKGTYDFFLVDLNRMAFHDTMSFELRMKNLCRLTPQEKMVALMSKEYAKASGEAEEKIFTTLWELTETFQYNLARKKRIKKKLLFWK